MAALPTNGTEVEILVRKFTDDALATRLANVTSRSVPPALRKAIIEEAARRLRWGTQREERS